MNPRTRQQPAPSTTDPTELLLYCLTLDRDEPAIGAVTAVQQELKLLSSLMLAEPPLDAFDAMTEMSATLEMLSRRLEVACELMRRHLQPEAQAGNDAGPMDLPQPEEAHAGSEAGPESPAPQEVNAGGEADPESKP